MYQVYLKAYIYSAVPFIGGRRQVPEYCLLIPSSSGGPFCLCLYNAISTSWPYSLEPGKETDSTESNQIISANTWNQDMRLHRVLLHPWMRPSNLKDWGWSTFTVWRRKKNRESWCAERKKQRCWGEKGERMSSIWKREPERYLIHESFLVLGSRLLATQIGSGISRWLGSGQRKKANSKSQVRNIGRYIPSSLDGVAWRHEMC